MRRRTARLLDRAAERQRCAIRRLKDKRLFPMQDEAVEFGFCQLGAHVGGRGRIVEMLHTEVDHRLALADRNGSDFPGVAFVSIGESRGVWPADGNHGPSVSMWRFALIEKPRPSVMNRDVIPNKHANRQAGQGNSKRFRRNRVSSRHSPYLPRI